MASEQGGRKLWCWNHILLKTKQKLCPDTFLEGFFQSWKIPRISPVYFLTTHPVFPWLTSSWLWHIWQNEDTDTDAFLLHQTPDFIWVSPVFPLMSFFCSRIPAKTLHVVIISPSLPSCLLIILLSSFLTEMGNFQNGLLRSLPKHTRTSFSVVSIAGRKKKNFSSTFLDSVVETLEINLTKDRSPTR